MAQWIKWFNAHLIETTISNGTKAKKSLTDILNSVLKISQPLKLLSGQDALTSTLMTKLDFLSQQIEAQNNLSHPYIQIIW